MLFNRFSPPVLLGALLASFALGCTSSTAPPAAATAGHALLGDDGNVTISTTTTVNRYQALRNDVAAAATQIRVPDVSAFGVAVGDLLLVMQMQGATIDTSDPASASWGQVTDLGNAGVYELVTITSLPSNTRINIQGACGGGLRNGYTVAAKTQVIFVPQYQTLTIDQSGQITAPAWNGTTGGVVALQAERLVLGGVASGAINVDGLGFRGGTRNSHADFRNQTAFAGNQDVGGEKGESIAGFQDDYNGGAHRYGRGAPANGGGGGNAHNCGGGGGANATNSIAYNGLGVRDVSTANNVTAWALEGAAASSSGGGRGGYSYASDDRDELTEGPADPDWGGDLRRNNGGRGGRPLSPVADSRIFLGGGGGAGDVNNGSTPTNGGAGGGIALILADRVERHTSGSFLIRANGANGGDAAGGAGQGNDAPGGAGGGGTIVLKSASVASIALVANGGRGGLQDIQGYGNESEGPGGGGGGGFIAVSAGAATTSVQGGAGGTSNSPAVANFPLNGATGGATGGTATATYAAAGIPACFDADLAVTLTPATGNVSAGATISYTVTYTNNGANRVNGAIASGTFDADLGTVSWTCVGAGCPAASGTGFSNLTLNPIDPAGTVVFTLSSPVSGGATGTIDVTTTIAAPGIITDGTASNNSASSSRTVTNPAPVNTIPGTTPTTNVDTARAFTAAELGVVDPDSATVTTTLTITSGVLSVGGSGGSAVVSNGGLTLTISGTLAQVNGRLDAVTFTPASGSTAAVTVTMVSTDGTNSDTDTFSIDVNSAPINTLPATASTNVNTALVFSAPQLDVTDVDSANVTTILAVTSGTITVGGAGGSVTNNGTASVTISGTLAQVQARLDAVTFTPASNSTAAVTLTMTSDDGSATDVDTCAINVESPPVNTTPATISVTEDTPFTFTAPQLGVADADSANVTTTLSVPVGGGTFTLAACTGTVTGNGTISVQLSGTLAQVNNCLDGLTYTPTTDNTTAVTMTMVTSDGVATDTDLTTINFTALNDPPLNQLPAAVTVTEDAAFVFPAANVGVTDPDDASLTTTVSVPIGGGTLAVLGSGGVVLGNGTNSVTISGTLGQINSHLDTLTFTPATDSTASVTLTMTSTDPGLLFDTDTCTITILPQNDPPQNAITATVSTNEDTAFTYGAAQLGVADIDSATVTTVLTISSGTIAVGNAGAGGTVTISGGGTIATIAGTLAEVNGRLDAVTVTPATDSTTTITMVMVTTDGGGGSDTDSGQITINALNDPPQNTLPATASTPLNTALVFAAAQVGVTDVDSPNVTTTLSVTSGTITVGGAGGTVTANGTASVVISGTLAQVNARLDAVTFTPVTGSSAAVTLTMASSDGLVSDVDQCAITISGSPPVNTLPASVSGTEDTARTIAGVAVNDPDSGQQLTTVLTIPGGSTIAVTTGGGATITGNGSGSVTIVGTQAQVNAALSGLTVTPLSNFNGPVTLTMTTTDPTSAVDTDTSTLTFAPTNDDPTATNDSATVGNNSIVGVLINVTANDSSAPDSGETLTVSSAGPATNGTATIVGNQVRYVPNPGFVGTDTLSYTISDGNGGTATATITVTVAPSGPNQAPVVTVPAPQMVAEDAPLLFGSSNAIVVSDPDSGSAQVELTIGVDHGTFTLSTTTGLTFLDGDGSGDVTTTVRGTIAQLAAALAGATFQGAADFFGTAQVTIAVDDLGNSGTGGALRDQASFEITVTPVNDPPTAVEDAATVPNDAPATIDVLGNDSSLPDGPETLAIDSVSVPAHGTAVITSGAIVYTPDPSYAGPDTFTYTITDGNGGTATATVTMTVVPPAANIGPTNGLPATASTDEDTALALPLSVSDPDAAGAPLRVSITVTNGALDLVTTTGLTFEVGDGSADGELTIVGSQTDLTAALATLVFTPAADFNGTATLFMTTSDLGNTGSGGAKLDTDQLAITVVSVNDAPTANDDTGNAEAGGSTVTLDVLANDAALPDVGEVLTIVNVTQPSSGSVTINGSQLRFTPGASADTVTFTYTIDDGHGGTATATVTITVLPAGVNNPPVNNVPAPQSSPEDTTLVFSTNNSNNVSVADVDAAATPITVTLVATNGVLTPGQTTTGVTIVGAGTSTLSLTGTVDAVNGALEGLGFAPTADYHGPATITVTTNDNGGTGTGGPQTDVDPIAITVTPVNDAPVANPDAVNTTATATIDVLANDSSGPDEGETLTVIEVTPPTHGTAAIVDGKIVYTPDAGYQGPDSFTYTISDGMGGTATATVTIEVADPKKDTDGDGIPDAIEEATGTDPNDDDTDDDGLLDGIEDTDHDGQNDPGDTDPRQADTDGDGLQDGTEIGLTEPQGEDTDPDVFMPDADPTTTTDPLDKDTDNGSVEDGDEDANHNGRIDTGERDPNNPTDDTAGESDIDGDGIPDRVEDASVCLDRADRDTDDDGLADGDEDANHNGVVDPGETDPCNPDSDGGGVPDGIEKGNGGDPTDRTDDRVFAVAGGGIGGCKVAATPLDSLASLLLLGVAFVVLSRRSRARS